jgi:hypothetical protein
VVAREVYVPVGVFDDPEPFEPEAQLGLPEARVDRHPPTVCCATRRAASPGCRQRFGPEPIRKKLTLYGKRGMEALLGNSFAVLRLDEGRRAARASTIL